MILPFLFGWLVHQTYKSEQEEKAVNGIFGITYKSRFVPVFKSLAFPELGWKSVTNIAFSIDKCGVYQIKENGKLVYIGASKDVYRKAMRHFQPYEAKEGSKQDYHKYLDVNEYTIRITLTNTPRQAYLLEAALIAKYQPRDNYIQPSIFYDQSQRAEAILTDYEDLGVMKLEDVPF